MLLRMLVTGISKASSVAAAGVSGSALTATAVVGACSTSALTMRPPGRLRFDRSMPRSAAIFGQWQTDAAICIRQWVSPSSFFDCVRHRGRSVLSAGLGAASVFTSVHWLATCWLGADHRPDCRYRTANGDFITRRQYCLSRMPSSKHSLPSWLCQFPPRQSCHRFSTGSPSFLPF